MKQRSAGGRLSWLVLAWLVLALGVPAGAQAQGKSQVRKLGRGLLNVVTGPLEIPKQAIREAKRGEEKNVGAVFLGYFTGLVLGAGYAVERSLAGVVEIISFPFPNPDGTYEPLVEPETVFSDGSWVEVPEPEEEPPPPKD
ncbi:MAG: exosortase system-associated protein, TIGR04073 family [Candidatus Tectomicrobia bacterium]|uniref:Exosortase system-associated protein, TIGR04073 family n=1 Tax=Tectimicrobiota bacterium TaxID=2528274 RepID=A0A932FXQ7_UNCTE|nr:exosortase system-associated protein, TIGR04073 family [Candidatus Tectomicrobia bacterium]